MSSDSENSHTKPSDSTIDDNVNVEKSSSDNQNNSRTKHLMATIFGFTITKDNNVKQPLVFIDSESMEYAVFDRLMLYDPQSNLLQPNCKKMQNVDSHFIQTDVICYLFECYRRVLQQDKNNNSTFLNSAKKIILRNVCTAFQEPALFDGQEIHKQFIDLFTERYIETELKAFLNDIVTEANLEEDESTDVIELMFTPILEYIRKKASSRNLFTYQKHWVFLLQHLSANKQLGTLLMKFNTPKNPRIGNSYEQTLFGSLLSISPLPKGFTYPFENIDEANINTALNQFTQSIYKIFYNLLKHSPEIHHLLMKWFGECLDANSSKGQIWNVHNSMNMDTDLVVSDGFMLNLNSVFLKLCEPFTCLNSKNGINYRLLKIDPTYCAVPPIEDEEERKRRRIHLRNMNGETCLIPSPEAEKRPISDNYNFITECFFMTHVSLDFGFRVVWEKLFKLNQSLGRLQGLISDVQTPLSDDIFEYFTQNIKSGLRQYLAYRAALLQTDMLNSLGQFHATTAAWLMQVYLNTEPIVENGITSYAPKEFKKIELPLPDTIPATIQCIPEFLIENTIGFLGFVGHIVPNLIEQLGPSFLNPILTEIVALMESSTKLYNPHLRARLVECLEAILPVTEEVLKQPIPAQGNEHRKQLFLLHPHKKQIAVSLMNVFVSIEMTGQSVQFEQKFNYRRPMYVVMAYLWKIPEHREVFKNLAKDAESNMEAVQPPLFLRFINLLINDAVFLLDDALEHMAQLRQLHQKRESEEWSNLSPEEQEEQLRNLDQIGIIARFDNILGKSTINTLNMLTTEIKSIFCHPTMVERIVAMLNYLLLKLVGPKQKNFKVKQQKEYKFDPADLVLNICHIYINLSNSKAFTLAVSQDGRSYSPQLFDQATTVLARIDGMNILNDLEQFALAVKEAARYKKEEEEILIDAPEEFLDPIMSTLMSDPVILPSSKITIDRQTIARHLLSDQTDPFNRSPLTMNMIIPDVELSKKIKEWIEKKKQGMSKTSDMP